MNNSLLLTSPPTNLNLEAVLLNGNLRSFIPREAIKTEWLLRYQKLIAARESTLILPSGEYRLTMDLLHGNALLHLSQERQLMCVAGVATGPLRASELWEFLVDLSNDSAAPTAPEPPRALPWLALHFSAKFVATADVHMFRRLSTLHWALGWAVVELAAEQQRRN